MNLNSTTNAFFDHPRNRAALFVLPLLAGLFVFGKSAGSLLLSSSELYSHIPVVYLISVYLVFRDRKAIFSATNYSPLYGVPLVLISIFLYAYGKSIEASLGWNDSLSVLSLAFIVFLAGLLISVFGTGAFHKMIFPAVFLIFAIPIPEFILSRIIYYLQIMSFYAAAWTLDFVGMMPIREGFMLIFPEIRIEVAEQCSGIRSSIALMIVSVLYGHFFLRTYACKGLLLALSLVIIPFKNGLRITALVFLAMYWDKAILSGPLHRIGGIPFFIVGLVWLGLVIVILLKVEKAVLKRFKSN